MTILNSVTLGIVEGLTEFLPVSSTGHLIIFSKVLGIAPTEFVKSFEVAIQLGAVLAVLARYARLLLSNKKIIWVLVVAFAPAAAAGLLLYKFVKTFLLGNTSVVLVSLAVGGLGLILFEHWQAKRAAPLPVLVAEVSYRQAFIIGCWQALAIVPGVSRAAATVVGGMALGLPRRTVVEFSFLLALPTMLAATALDLSHSAFGFSRYEFGLLGVGFVTAFGVAWFAVKWLLDFVEHHTFTLFGWYRILMAASYYWWIIRS